MHPAVVRVIDLGLDPPFAASTTLAQSVAASVVAQEGEHPRVEVELIRTRSLPTVMEALLGEADVIHVVSHASATAGEAWLASTDGRTVIDVHDLAEECRLRGEGLRAPVLLMDACTTASRHFLAAVGECVSQDTAYIGTRRQVGWIEGTAFASAFYSAYLRRRGKAINACDRGADAAERAISAYPILLGPDVDDCPYQLHRLGGSTAPQRAA